MPREEDFSDIPELGPADEDRVAASIPTLEASQAVHHSASAAAKAPKKSSSPLMWGFILLLVAAVGFSGYQQLQLQQQLSASESALLQAQSRLADLESLVSATDDSASKTGAALLAQLKRQQKDREARITHVDSEIRKLWAIYQKYKPTIDGLEETQGQQAKQLSGQQKELKTVGTSLESLGLSMDQQSDKVKQLQTTLGSSSEQLAAVKKDLATQLSRLQDNLRSQDLRQQEVDDIQAAELADFKAKLNQMGNLSQIQAALAEQQRSIDSINANRRQVNGELLKLRTQLGQLQAAQSP